MRVIGPLYLAALVAILAVARAWGPASASEPTLDASIAYPDVLALRGAPEAAEDWRFAPFSDQGAWFGFAAPSEERPDLWGGFIGPFLMPEGRWLSPQLARLELRSADDGEPLRFESAREHRSWVYPGSLRQETRWDGLTASQTLWFDSAHTALLRTVLSNTSDELHELDASWVGRAFEGATITNIDGGVAVTSAAETTVRARSFATPLERTDSSSHGEFRVSRESPLSLQPGESVSLSLAFTMTLPGQPSPTEEMVRAVDADASWQRNVSRWNGYLSRVDTGRTADDPIQILAVKSLMTLVNNWRGPAGRMRYSALFPSSNVWYFNGFWAWDSWKHAVGIVNFDSELAKDQIRAMFDHQDETGMIADVVYLDAAEDNWRDTKPPLAGWAIQTVYDITGDLGFVRDLYPKLVAYHRFWYAHRDHDGDGLCEYGSTDGTIVAARWESGMDNAVRFDETAMLQNGPDAWSMNQESVDLNCYLYREKVALAALARALDNGESAGWNAEAMELKQKIQLEMFDTVTGWFYDIAIDFGEIVPVQGPEGWIPLWAEVASEAQAARVRETMLDPAKFHTHVPFPTVARDDPGFSDGYWRGLVWLDQVFFAIRGLENYGYLEDARLLREELFANLDGATARGEPLRENYHPLTGEGQNVHHFSWTAAHLLLLAISH